MRYDLVIFDNDGVLVDSEPISNRHLAAYLTELGHPTSYEDSIRDYMGSAMHRVHDLVLERTGQRLPADFDDVFHARVFAAFERELKPVAGAVDVLEALTARGVPYCVASSGSHERIRVGHRTTGLDRWFDDARIFSSQDVGRGKPAPRCGAEGDAARRMVSSQLALKGRLPDAPNERLVYDCSKAQAAR